MTKAFFSNSDFYGNFGVCFDGFMVLAPASTPPPPSDPKPINAVGLMIVAGNGTLTVRRTVNNNGEIRTHKDAPGTYTVHDDGTGTASLTVVDYSQSPPFSYKEIYSFVLSNQGLEVQFVSLTMTDLQDNPLPFVGVIRGVGRKQ